MRAVQQVTDVPLSKAFRYWADEHKLRPAYRLRMELLCERDPDRRASLRVLADEHLERARQSAWRRLKDDREPVTISGILQFGDSSGKNLGRKRTTLSPEALSGLTPNFAKSSAEDGSFAYFDIRISGLLPMWVMMSLDDDAWGSLDTTFSARDDYREVQLNGEIFSLGKAQAEIIATLHFKHQEGKPIVSMKEALNGRVGHTRDYFKKEKSNLLVYPKRGFVRLNIP
jgi:hypothetical protein